MPQACQGPADPDCLSGPAIGAQAPSNPDAIAPHSASACSAAARADRLRLDRIDRLGKMEVGDRFDEFVPFPRRRLFHLVEVGAAEPVQGRSQPVFVGPAISAPPREGPADEQIDGDGLAGGKLDRRDTGSLHWDPVGSHSTSPRPSSASANSMVASRASLRLEWPCPRLMASKTLSMSCQLNPRSPTPPLISA